MSLGVGALLPIQRSKVWNSPGVRGHAAGIGGTEFRKKRAIVLGANSAYFYPLRHANGDESENLSSLRAIKVSRLWAQNPVPVLPSFARSGKQARSAS